MSARPKRAPGVTLLVGAGRMGGALLEGWISQRLKPIAVVEPAPGARLRTHARQRHIRLLARIADARDLRVAACVVALKPQVLQYEALHLTPIARSGALMLSIAAGTSIAALRKAWGRRACIVRAMPNTPGAVGRGITALYAPPATVAQTCRRAQSLVAALGQTLWVEREELIDVVTAVSGSGPAYVYLFAECLSRAARAEGLPADISDTLARITVSGAGALLEADPRAIRDLRRDVTSPGGTTAAALQVLTERDAFGELIFRAVAAARARATELRGQAET